VKAFAYERAASIEDAAAKASAPNARLIAGGTNLIDLMKLQIETPEVLVDISRLPLAELEDEADGGFRIGALATNAAVANHRRVRADYPVLARAILAGASAQLRNKASVGGNLLQRTRCGYFYDLAKPCNKRTPGRGCAALEGLNRMNAVLGADDACIAVHPSDMAVALAALRAEVETVDASGQRRLRPLDALYDRPADAPQTDTALTAGEVISAVRLPPPPKGRQVYRKARDRASYAFALVSVAAVGDAGAPCAALGGVAPRPWTARKAEAAVRSGGSSGEAAAAELAFAKGRGENDFKIVLAERMLKSALDALMDPL